MRTPASAAQTTGSNKFLGIELLRFITAAAVLVFHYQHFYSAGALRFDVTRQPFYESLSFFYHYGYYGVQIFWCISGFIFFARYGQSVSAGRESSRSFSLARFSRLYPLHLLTLLAVAGLQQVYSAHHGTAFVYQHNDLSHFIRQLFMLSSWQAAYGSDTYSFNGPIWSVSLELVAYVVSFAVTRVAGSSLATVLATLVVVSAIDRLAGHHPVFTCLIYFFLGAGIFKLFSAVTARRATAAALVSASLVALLAGGLNHFDKLPAPFATLAIAPSVLLVVALLPGRGSDWFERVTITLGNTTYSSYLLHFPVQLLCVLLAESLGEPLRLASPWFFGVYLIGTFLLAAVCYRMVEWPTQQWLRLRFGTRR